MNTQVCILFTESPEGTRYKANHYYHMDPEKAQKYIEAGAAKPHTPKRASASASWAEVPEPEEEKAPEIHVHVEEKKAKPKLKIKKKKDTTAKSK